MSNLNYTVDNVLKNQRVVILCGSGGVGKTTTSGALALKAAMAGRKVVVVTIDPAKRLATSLGISSLTSEPTNVSHLLKDRERGGELWAVMPDTNEVFESFVRSMSRSDSKSTERVLRTSIYKIFARDFSGANEYMAMEKLSQLYNDSRFDMIVLDTPPAPNAVAFLNAPGQLSRFFDDNIIKWFVAPGSRILTAGLRKILEILERLTGKGFISELLEFTAALFELKTQFVSNLNEIGALLRSETTSFIMVTTPERFASADTEQFVEHLIKNRYPFWGFLVNKSLVARLRLKERTEYKIIASEDAPKATTAQIACLQKLFKLQIPRLEKELEILSMCEARSKNVVAVRVFDQDIHTVDGLSAFAAHMSPTETPTC